MNKHHFIGIAVGIVIALIGVKIYNSQVPAANKF
jgi:hypothetical protein